MPSRIHVKRNIALPLYIRHRLNHPFQWGVNDCITFTIEWVESCTGLEYLAPHKPWNNAAEAHLILRRLGGVEGLMTMFDRNGKRIHPNLAQDGDVTIYKKAANIFTGNHIITVGKNDLICHDRSLATCAWTF